MNKERQWMWEKKQTRIHEELSKNKTLKHNKHCSDVRENMITHLPQSQNCCHNYKDEKAETDILIKPTGVINASNHDLINHN